VGRYLSIIVGCGWMGEESSVMTDGCGSLSVGLGWVVIWRRCGRRGGSGERREVMSGVRLKECCIRVREHDALVNADNMVIVLDKMVNSVQVGKSRFASNLISGSDLIVLLLVIVLVVYYYHGIARRNISYKH
jgi:hypothetical protein